MNRNINIILSGQLISQLGDRFYQVGMAFWILQQTGSASSMSIAMAAYLIPALLSGLISGSIVDRLNMKKIVVTTDTIRGLIVLLVSIAAATDTLTFQIIILSQVLLAINSSLFDPAVPSIISLVTSKENLVKVNSKSQLIYGVSNIAGPVSGGLIIASAGYSTAFFLNALSYLISAAFESRLALPDKKISISENESIIRTISDAYIYIKGKKYLLTILYIVGAIHLFTGSLNVMLPVLADKLTGTGTINFGLLEGSFGFGAVLMGTYFSYRKMRRSEHKNLLSSIFITGILYTATGTLLLQGVKTPVWYMVTCLLTGSTIILAATCFRTIIQKNTDQIYSGRVFGIVSAIGNGSIPLGMLISGFLLESVPPSLLLIFTGLLLSANSAIFIFRFSGGDDVKSY